MLFEPGPLVPIDVDLWTRPGPKTNLEGDAASLAAQLGAHDSAISGAQQSMRASWSPGVAGDAGLDLGAAAGAHDQFAKEFDSSVAAIATNADAQTGTIAALINDTGDDLKAGEPPLPEPVTWPPPPSWGIGEGNPPPEPEPTPPPGGTVADFIIGLYQKYLRRSPSTPEINNWADHWPNKDLIEHGILYSQENADKVNALYRQWLERDVTGDELAEARAKFWSLDDVEADVKSRA